MLSAYMIMFFYLMHSYLVLDSLSGALLAFNATVALFMSTYQAGVTVVPVRPPITAL